MIEVIPNWHPVAVHFTVALLITASALFVAATVLGARPAGPALTGAARLNLAIGIAVTVPTLATGWVAYNTVAHDAASHENMTVHLRWALGTALLFLAAGTVAWIERRRGAGLLLLALLAGGSGALAVTGWLGGENVYRYGLGVMRLPTPGDHVHPGSGGHAHDHPHEHGHDHGPAHDHEHASPVGAGEPDAAQHDSGNGAPPEASSPAHEHAH